MIVKGSLLLLACFTIASLSHLPAQTDPSSAQNTAGSIPSAPAIPASECSTSLCKDKDRDNKDDKDWELPSSGTVTVPAKNGVEFDAMIDGKGPFRLIFDSGAGVNVLSPAVAKQLGLRVGGDPLLLKGTGGSVLSRAVHVDTLRIGGLALHDQMFYVSPMPWGDRPGPVGAVGYELMRRLVVTVDYQRQQLTFNAPLLFNDSGHGVKVPLEPPPHGIQVKASVDGESGVFGIDTGDEASLGLQEWFVSQYGFVKRLAPPYHGYAGSGVGGPMPSAYYGRVQTLRIG